MFKNKLQEYYQKRGLPLPTYQSSVSGPSHAPQWISKVSHGDGLIAKGQPSSSRVNSEQSAAEAALDQISEKREKLKIDKSTVLLVDIENLQTLIDQLLEYDLPDDLEIYGFVSEHHHLAEKEFSVNKVIVPSSHRDAVDTCIQIYTGIFLMEGKYDHYLIATRDHFASSLVQMIRAPGFPWTPKTASIITGVKSLLQ